MTTSIIFNERFYIPLNSQEIDPDTEQDFQKPHAIVGDSYISVCKICPVPYSDNPKIRIGMALSSTEECESLEKNPLPRRSDVNKAMLREFDSELVTRENLPSCIIQLAGIDGPTLDYLSSSFAA